MNSLDLKKIPTTPGIYKFFSKNKIIYIGKAKNLKNRVSSYFGNSLKDRKTHQIKILTDEIETFSTNTEAEALLLEQSLIKENLPRFNILLRDDKTYPYIHFSMNHNFPGVSLKRTKHAVSKDFFGPFISAHAVKSTIKDLQKIYQIRNCSDSTFKNRSRPCIEHQMKRCSAPCAGFVDQSTYKSDIFSSQQYLSSSSKNIRSSMKLKMQKFADNQEFEQANEIKKRIRSLDLLHQEQSFNSKLRSIDIFACISRVDRTGVCILSVREGKIRGTKTHYLKGNHLLNIDNLYQGLIFSYYQNIFSLPEKIILSSEPENPSLITDAIKLKFNKDISITHKTNTDSRKLLKLAKFNADQVVETRINQSDKYIFAINVLSKLLGIKKKNLIIEGYDVSHHGGKDGVAAAVVFSNEGPNKSRYRLFNIPSDVCGDDIASIKNVLERRIKKSLSSPLPDIILIDGGKTQLNAALDTFSKIEQKPPLIMSIVKGKKRIRATETILVQKGILEVPIESAGFTLLQQIRDESHRFAIKNNRKKKRRNIQFSSFDKITGIGPVKKKNLLNYFKSIKKIRAASIDNLCKVDGISIKLAKQIKKNL